MVRVLCGSYLSHGEAALTLGMEALYPTHTLEQYNLSEWYGACCPFQHFLLLGLSIEGCKKRQSTPQAPVLSLALMLLSWANTGS